MVKPSTARTVESLDPAASIPMHTGETVLARFEADLDRELHYAKSTVVLTNQRVLASNVSEANSWQEWSLRDDLVLENREQTGAGSLELGDGTGRLASWRYTNKQTSTAQLIVGRFHALRSSRHGAQDSAGESVCPTCGGIIRDEDRCLACAPKARTSLSSLYRLAGFARGSSRLIALGFVLTVGSMAAGLVPPYLTMPLLDDVLIPHQTGGTGNFHLLVYCLAGLFGAALLSWILDIGRLYVLARASEQVCADLRAQTYSHLLRLSVEFFGGKRTGDLMARIGSDSERLCNFLSLNVVDFATDILMIVMTAIILLTIDPMLALAAIVPFPFIVFLVYRVRSRLLRGYQQAGVAWSSISSVLADTIPGIRVVKAFAQETHEVDRFDDSNQRVFDVNDGLNRIWALFGPTVTLLTTGGLLIIWSYASWQVFRGEITVGVLTAFLAYLSRFYVRIESMIRMISATQRAAASAQRIFEILDRQPSVPEPRKPIQPGRLEGAIELRQVRFRYGPRQVLHGINLSIRPGEMIGLVGPSGAGKSTLINLICRFYDVAAGAILVDGVDIRSFPVEVYRKNIGIVLQDPFLFYGTVAENIAYGKPEATREEIVAAARAALAHDFILKLPDRYDSLVGERGQSLSGGERQRLSIARALLIDPRLLILDEATSSVDTETEREIQLALENLVRGRTTIAIAHRLSTLRRADRLVVVDSGNIVEVGTHEELLGQAGVYARLHQAQLEIAREHAV